MGKYSDVSDILNNCVKHINSDNVPIDMAIRNALEKAFDKGQSFAIESIQEHLTSLQEECNG